MRRSIAILVGVAFVVAAFSDRALSQGTPEGKEDLALHDLDAVAALQKNNPIAYYNRGYVHFAKRQYDLAADDNSAAIGLDPKMGVKSRPTVTPTLSWD